MLARIAQWQPDQGAAATARAVGALALAALAVIHVVDLPGTLGPDRLVGIGYLGIIAAAILIGGVLIARPHWLAWAATAAVAASAMIGYVLTRGLQGGFLGDHGDVGNWHCPLGIAAASARRSVRSATAGRPPAIPRWPARAVTPSTPSGWSTRKSPPC
ncbi:MAG: hypothetical protein ACRDOD_01785 [Streptosporangiaceae bacterium]